MTYILTGVGRYEDVPADAVRGKGKGKGVSICKTMFPPLGDESAEGDQSLSEVMAGTNKMIAAQLHRCRRVLPSQGDTGGFFVALLQRTRSAKEPQPQPQPEPEPAAEQEAKVEAETGVVMKLHVDKAGWGDAGRSSRRWVDRKMMTFD